jgi:hypothetical protein
MGGPGVGVTASCVLTEPAAAQRAEPASETVCPVDTS